MILGIGFLLSMIHFEANTPMPSKLADTTVVTPLVLQSCLAP